MHAHTQPCLSAWELLERTGWAPWGGIDDLRGSVPGYFANLRWIPCSSGTFFPLFSTQLLLEKIWLIGWMGDHQEIFRCRCLISQIKNQRGVGERDALCSNQNFFQLFSVQWSPTVYLLIWNAARLKTTLSGLQLTKQHKLMWERYTTETDARTIVCAMLTNWGKSQIVSWIRDPFNYLNCISLWKYYSSRVM